MSMLATGKRRKYQHVGRPNKNPNNPYTPRLRLWTEISDPDGSFSAWLNDFAIRYNCKNLSETVEAALKQLRSYDQIGDP